MYSVCAERGDTGQHHKLICDTRTGYMDGRVQSAVRFENGQVVCDLSYPFGTVGKIADVDLRSAIGESLPWTANALAFTWSGDCGSGEPPCNAAAGGGECSVAYGCVCQPGYSGPNCDVFQCPFGCFAALGHGRCAGPPEVAQAGTCVCLDDWTGPHCSRKACPNDNCQQQLYGRCVAELGLCVCFAGRHGPGCDQLLCTPPNCSGHGTCDTQTGTCQCESGWKAPFCTLFSVSGIFFFFFWCGDAHTHTNLLRTAAHSDAGAADAAAHTSGAPSQRLRG